MLDDALAMIPAAGNGAVRQSSIGSEENCCSTCRTIREHTGLTPEVCFQRAIDIARRQQVKGLELRAAMSLSRLWHQEGNI